MTNEQAVEARWPAVLKLLGPRRKVTALLRDARVAAVQANDVTLEFDYAFHAEQVGKPENRLVTEKALQRVFGRPLRVRPVVKGATEHSTVEARIRELEQTLAATRAKLDRERAARSTADGQARQKARELDQKLTAAQAEHDQELEQAVADANAKHAQELEQAVAAAQAKHAQELEQAVAAAQAEHDQELEQAVAAAKAEHDQELEQAVAAAKTEHAQELESRIEGIESKALTFDFIAAWGRLEDALKQLKSEMLQGKKHQIDARKELPIRLQLRLASDKGYISKDQYTNLESMKVLRDAIAHDGLPLTSGQVHGNLPILDDIITQLHQRSPRTSS